MSLITVGTMAFDAIETPFGKVDKIVGGSVTYVAYAASYFVKPVKNISIIGYDFPDETIADLKGRGVEMEGVEVMKDEKSFFWSGKYHLDMNTRDTLITDLNVLSHFDPKVPDSYQGADVLMLGNLMPSLQISVIEQLTTRPQIIIMDTMNFWMETALDDLKKVMKMVDVLLVNDEEARMLSGQPSLVKAAKHIMDMGPQYLIIKKGEHGALLFHDNMVFAAPALPLDEVFDPTGAGDTFAGGFAGYLASIKKYDYEAMKTALIVGSAMASFCVEKFGPEQMLQLSKDDIHARIRKFINLVSFEAAVL